MHQELVAPGDDLGPGASTVRHLAPRVRHFAAECSEALSSTLRLDQDSVLRDVSVDVALELRAVRRSDCDEPKIVLLPLAEYWAGRRPSQRGNQDSLLNSRAGELRMTTVEPYSLLDCDQVASVSGTSLASKVGLGSAG